MKQTFSLIVIVLLAGAILVGFQKSHSSTNKLPKKITTLFEPIAVVELFTSQGCSSCPPADRLLSQTISNKNGKKIFALSYHVDYWNRLGWTDPFSNAGFSKRQNEYVQALNINGAYTPQVIVNGNNEFVGSDRAALTAALSKALKVKAEVNFKQLEAIQTADNTIKVTYVAEGDFTDANINFALVSLSETTAVKRGENGGATLTSENIVRQLVTKKAVGSGEITFSGKPIPAIGNAAVIVFIQEQSSFNIVGAAMAKF
ncbi:MAG: DUF1223 domain-containing protein [Ferruginibacter sp.]